jgi:hypothetical protein
MLDLGLVGDGFLAQYFLVASTDKIAKVCDFIMQVFHAFLNVTMATDNVVERLNMEVALMNL